MTIVTALSAGPPGLGIVSIHTGREKRRCSFSYANDCRQELRVWGNWVGGNDHVTYHI